MSIYKKFSKSDISITPFTAHKQNTFTSSSLINAGGSYHRAKYPGGSEALWRDSSNRFSNDLGRNFKWAKTGSVFGADLDINNVKKYFQLDHLFYKNSKTDYINKFNTVEYFDHYRILHKEVNIISLPYKTIGYKIKPNSFLITTGSYTLRDDGKGNLYDTQFTLGDLNFKNEKFRIFYLGPEGGHKAYDLDRKNGYKIIDPSSTYSSGKTAILDDSFFFNELTYKDVTFSEKSIFSPSFGNYPLINFNGSYISSPHDSKYNFNSDDNFAVSFFVSSSGIDATTDELKKYLISKSTTKKTILTPNPSTQTSTTGSSQIVDIPSEASFPFEIYYQSQSIHFDRFDGTTISSVSTIVTSSKMVHVTCQKTGSNLELYVNGDKLATSTDNTTLTENTADLFIGNKGGNSNYFTGSMIQIMIFDDALNQTQINNLSQSIDNKPYVGNVFYSNGFATITKPNYIDFILGTSPSTRNFTLQYQGRGVTEQDIVKYNIHYSETGDLKNMIVIPSYDENGNVNYYVGRSFDKNAYIKHKLAPATKDIIGFDLYINWDLPIILCEGAFDAMAIKRNAIPLFGKKISSTLMKKILTSNCSKVYLALDDDAFKDALDHAKKLMSYGKRVYFIEMEGKDPSELGFKKFTQLLYSAEELTMSSLVRKKLALS